MKDPRQLRHARAMAEANLEKATELRELAAYFAERSSPGSDNWYMKHRAPDLVRRALELEVRARFWREDVTADHRDIALALVDTWMGDDVDVLLAAAGAVLWSQAGARTPGVSGARRSHKHPIARQRQPLTVGCGNRNCTYPSRGEDELTTVDVLARIATRMKEQKLTAQDLAEAIGVSKFVMSRILNDGRRLTAAELGRIADRLGTTATQLLGRASAPTRPLAMAARLGTAGHDDPTIEPALNRTRTLLELRNLLSRLVESPPRTGTSLPARPTTRSYVQAGDQMAAAVRDSLDLAAGQPILDLTSIIEDHYGADVSREPLANNIAGLLITDPNEPDQAELPASDRVAVMLVNSTHRYGRQRFSLAHELGHLLFGDAEGLVLTDYLNGTKSFEESRADCFAAAFLMPAKGVQALAAQLGEAPAEREAHHSWLCALVSRLSVEFGVSVESAGYRLMNLKLITEQDRAAMSNHTASGVLRDGGCVDQATELDNAHVDVVAPPPHLRDLALFAYQEGMVGIEPLAQLWRSEHPEELRRSLAESGWEPSFA